MDKRKIIIDTDPGIDDAVAIMYAFKNPNIEILGITTVAGNKGLKCTTSNATKLSSYFGKKTPIYKGANCKLEDIGKDIENNDATGLIHGEDGLGGVSLKEDISLVQDKSAIDFILETVNKYPNEVDIVALGPVTNIALCIEKDLETMKKVKSIHSMGGGVFVGNMTPVSEFNYWFDPLAVDIMFNKLGKFIPIYMVGLDVTNTGLFDMNDMTFMRFEGGELGNLIADMSNDYFTHFWDEKKKIHIIIHDLVTMVGYMHPEIYTKVYHSNLRCISDSEIAYGQCIVDLVDSWKLEKNAYVPMEMDVNLYKNEVIKILFGEKSLNYYKNL